MGTDPYLGAVVGGRYKILRELGRGAMGRVYLAQHVLIEKMVAVKMLSPRMPDASRLLREAKTAARLEHDHVVDITDFGETDGGEVFLVMEYLKGRSLGDHVAEGAMPLERVFRIMSQIFDALIAAHDHHVIHRDLKPDNIFLVEHDQKTDFVKILDFGLATIRELGSAKASGEGLIIGTPSYMAPEQARGEPAHESFDIYAVGCILYELLTGTPPFLGESPPDILMAQIATTPTPPSERNRSAEIPVVLERVVLRALAKKPSARFESMRELADAVEACEPSAAGAPPRRRPRPPVSVRSRALPFALAFASTLLLVAGTAFLYSGRDGRDARARAAHVEAQLARGALLPPANDPALPAWRAAWALHPGHPALAPLASRLAAALVAQAGAATDAGRWEAAIPLLENAASLAPADPRIQDELLGAKKGRVAAASGMVHAGNAWIDRYEYPNRRGAVPLTRVDFGSASALCAAAGKHLCSESEWERACAGDNAQPFPYAAEYQHQACATELTSAEPLRAGARPRCVSASGAADLSGNVAEWTASSFTPNGPQKVVRGGSWRDDAARVSCTARDYFMPGQGGARHLGFRCCL